MRRVRYQVACSLDGFIAGPEDDFGWITPEPSFDFDELYAQFDTLLMGRRTYEVVRAAGEGFRGKQVLVASRTLASDYHPGIEIVRDGLEERIRELRSQSGGEYLLRQPSWDGVRGHPSHSRFSHDVRQPDCYQAPEAAEGD